MSQNTYEKSFTAKSVGVPSDRIVTGAIVEKSIHRTLSTVEMDAAVSGLEDLLFPGKQERRRAVAVEFTAMALERDIPELNDMPPEQGSYRVASAIIDRIEGGQNG